MGETVAFTYRAFISYSHADTSWAKWLHRGLESFRIDKDLAGRETETGPVPASLRPVFRDRDDFTAGALRSVRAGHAVRDHMSRAHPDNVAYRYAVAESHADAATVLTRQGEGV